MLEDAPHVSLPALDVRLSSGSASSRPTGGGLPAGGSGDVEDEDEEDDGEEDELPEGVTHGPLSTLPSSSRLASPERGVEGVPRTKTTGESGLPPRAGDEPTAGEPRGAEMPASRSFRVADRS